MITTEEELQAKLARYRQSPHYKKFDEYTLPFLEDGTDDPYILDTPIEFLDVDNLRAEASKRLDKIIEVQKIIDAQYSHEQLVEIGQQYHQQGYRVYFEPGVHQVRVYLNRNGDEVTYFFSHQPLDIDYNIITDEVCKIINIPVEHMELRSTIDRDPNRPRQYCMGVVFVHLKTYSESLLHTHASPKLLYDQATLIMPIAGKVIFTMATPPDDPNLKIHERELKGLFAFNGKKIHGGRTDTEGSYFMYVKPHVSFPEILESTKNIKG